jgi:acyl-CoA reductase-like NAD-dependent aldehyde dehydrogenase
MAQTRAPENLKSFNPATGQVFGEVRANTPEEVREAVAHARKAQPEWADLPAPERSKFLAQVRHRIFDRMDDIVATVSAENGKPDAEALAHDVLPSLITLQYLERLAPKALRPQRVARVLGPLMGGSASRIEWRPFGVVGCITPWNYPFYLSFMAITPALLAGNCVVLKPTEMTPGVGERVREVLEPLPSGVATVVQGAGPVGAALVDAPCDKICFIGSGATGRRIAEAAAKHLTPVVMELGGQDAAVVCSDADVEIASSGVLFGAFLNAGQTCRAIERVYVADDIADRFEEKLVEKLNRVRAGAGGDIGPLTVPRQLETVQRHVRDAVAKGARVLAGGPSEGDGQDDGLWFRPTIMEGRSEDMDMFREETFGPVLPIVRVRDEDEAVRRANEEGFNLTASVWTRDRKKADRLAGRLRAGSVTVNDHASSSAAPWGLWGGVGESGYGRLHGELGLREFTVPVHVATNVMPRLKRAWWYPYDEATTRTLRSFAEFVGAPDWGQKRRALGAVLRNARTALKNKI